MEGASDNIPNGLFRLGGLMQMYRFEAFAQIYERQSYKKDFNPNRNF